MFKVECEGCKAPYQVDERRVPATGLKMRCPKCGVSFVVTAPDLGAELPATAAPKRPVEKPAQPASPLADLPASLGARSPPRPPAGPPGAPAAIAGPASAPAVTVRQPLTSGSVDELDLDLPAALGPAAPVRTKREAEGQLEDGSEVDLPSATSDLPRTKAGAPPRAPAHQDRKSTRLNSSH